MNTIDPAKAARVWQRVQGETRDAPQAQELREMIVREWTDSALCGQLAHRIPGKEGALLRQLHEQETAHTACLKGIYTLITGQRPAVQALQPRVEDIENALRRCYGSKMHCLAWYEAHSHDPEYGPVYARLARQEQEHCRMLLEVLGKLR